MLLYFGQRSQIYFPVRESDLPGAGEIRLATHARAAAPVAAFPAVQVRSEVLPGATHNGFARTSQYLERIEEFLAK